MMFFRKTLSEDPRPFEFDSAEQEKIRSGTSGIQTKSSMHWRMLKSVGRSLRRNRICTSYQRVSPQTFINYKEKNSNLKQQILPSPGNISRNKTYWQLEPMTWDTEGHLTSVESFPKFHNLDLIIRMHRHFEGHSTKLHNAVLQKAQGHKGKGETEKMSQTKRLGRRDN